MAIKRDLGEHKEMLLFAELLQLIPLYPNTVELRESVERLLIKFLLYDRLQSVEFLCFVFEVSSVTRRFRRHKMRAVVTNLPTHIPPFPQPPHPVLHWSGRS